MLKHLYGIKQNNKYLLIQGILLIVLCLCLTGCNQKGRKEKKQLYYAIFSPNIQGVKEAIKKDKSIVNEKMKTLAEEDDLNSLIWLGRSDTVKKILEENMTKGRIRKEVLLQSAIDVGDFPMVRYLVKEGADINAYVKDEVENFKWTSMQMAYGRESVEIRKYLQKNGGDTTKKDSYGRSCKEIAKEAEAVWNLE